MHSLSERDHTGPVPELKLNVWRVIVWRVMYWSLIVPNCFFNPECHTLTDKEISRGQGSNRDSELTVQGKDKPVGFRGGLDPTWRAKSSITAWENLFFCVCEKHTKKAIMSFPDQRSPWLLIKFLKEIGVNVELFCPRANAKTRDGAASPKLG